MSSNKHETQHDNDGNDDDLMSKALSKKLASLSDKVPGQAESDTDCQHPGLNDFSKIARHMLMDENLDIGELRPFLWSMLETYLDRFQVLPFDAVNVLFSDLESRDFPEQEMRGIMKRLKTHYRQQHGNTMRDSEQQPARSEIMTRILDDEISELRETLKYAAIVGGRYDGDE